MSVTKEKLRSQKEPKRALWDEGESNWTKLRQEEEVPSCEAKVLFVDSGIVVLPWSVLCLSIRGILADPSPLVRQTGAKARALWEIF